MWNQAAHAQRLVAAEADRARLIQQQMLDQMQAMSKATSAPRSADWIPISFKLTQGTPDGLPAAGIQARLGRGNQGGDNADAIQRSPTTRE